MERTINMMITDKDWNRMTALVLSGKDGAGTAKVIKDKNKAIARFIAGVKLENEDLRYSKNWKQYLGSFSEFGNKALSLGASVEEIQNVFEENEVPSEYSEKLVKFANKKLRNRFVGYLSKRILDEGFDIEFLPHTGYAITQPGKDIMAQNGRKWTIGYKTRITIGESKIDLVFDAITDEGDGPTSYIIHKSGSSDLFKGFSGWEGMGKIIFRTKIMEILKHEEKKYLQS